MKNSINNLKNQLTSRQVLTNQQLFAIKGGDGEDKRKDDKMKSNLNKVKEDIATATTTIKTTIIGG